MGQQHDKAGLLLKCNSIHNKRNIQSGSLRATVKYRTIQYRYDHSPIAISTRGDLPPSVEVEVEPPDTQSSEAQRSRSK
jgi:hypothetical protein